MGLFSRTLVAAAVAMGTTALGATGAEAAIRIAFGDIASIESLHILAGIERAKERGVAIEVTYFQAEDIAAQAIVGGQADVGIGAPYALIQRANAPIRIFAQISKLRFFPVVNSEFYDSWEDLNGQEIAVQGRGSGTEAVMLLMARLKNIQYSQVSYVPGSEVRAGALLQGTLRASIVDAANRRLLEQRAPGKFLVLPLDELSASDETLFANTAYLASNQADVDILLEEILKVIREVADNPSVAVDLRRQYNLLPDLGPQADEEVLAYFTETVEGGALPLNGGGPDAAADDLGFVAAAGQIEGDPASLDVGAFWEFGPLERVIATVGTR